MVVWQRAFVKVASLVLKVTAVAESPFGGAWMPRIEWILMYIHVVITGQYVVVFALYSL